jgi:hypothetical protein
VFHGKGFSGAVNFQLVNSFSIQAVIMHPKFVPAPWGVTLPGHSAHFTRTDCRTVMAFQN